MAPSTFAKVATALGEDELLLASLTGHEALARPFLYELDLFSEDPDLDFKAVLNEPATIRLELKEQTYRYINGIVTRFGRVGEAGRHVVYRATLRPWLWLLTRSMDCRIFDQITIPDVITTIFRDHGFSQFDVKLSRDYRKWDYLVQYRESAFNFVQRLMEQEGLYYYFRHEDGNHTLVITDSHAIHDTPPGYESLPYYPAYSGEQRERDHIDGWRVTQEIQTGSCVLNDFDFRKPKADLLARRNAQFKPDRFELYDYPGEYEEVKDAEGYVRVWKEQVDSQYETVEGQGNARGVVLGGQFSLTGFPRQDQNRTYVVTGATYSLDTGAFESATRSGQGPTYRVAFQALDTAVPFRPARETPKPEIRGPQTAIVVGYQKGDEIHTDQYGRVKVHFPWVRKNEHEKVSCWVRVAQIWAGTRWGGMHIPRVGQEVIVEFLEGDPDRPIITGRVYNADSMPPYDLPANKTQSGIKSRSSKGGTTQNFNELRFEDKKGEEQLYMQAEKNMDSLVKNDQTLTVGANRTKAIGKNETTTVGENRTETVTLNEKIDIGGDRLETVIGTETINITGARTETLLATETISILGARTETVGGAETITLGNVRTTNIAMSDTLIIGGAKTLVVGGGISLSAAGASTIQVGKSQSSVIVGSDSVSVGKGQKIDVSNDREASVGGSDKINAKKKIVVTAGEEIQFVTGSASITLKKNGDVTIKGKNIKVEGSGKIDAKASGNVTIKGSKIAEN
jgi:type VI secretion system secreted protein VgrG